MQHSSMVKATFPILGRFRPHFFQGNFFSYFINGEGCIKISFCSQATGYLDQAVYCFDSYRINTLGNQEKRNEK